MDATILPGEIILVSGVGESRAWCPGASPPDNSCSPKNKGDGKSGDKGGGGGSKKSGKVHDGTGLAMNDDGTVTVYHHTSAANADKIKATGKLKSAGEPHVYVTTQADTTTGYGDTAVPIKVNPDDLELDDEFGDGRKDFKISVDRPGGEVKVAIGEREASKAVKAWAEKKFENPEHAKAFTSWFGDSKVVNEGGEPIVVYHGTGASFDEFKPSAKGMLGPGIYASADKGDYGPYSPYAGKDNAQVVPVYMSIKNPHYAVAGDVKTFDAPAGTDGTILIDKRTKKILWAVARTPTAVKSATGNSGTFDPKNPKITRSRQPESRECGANADGGGGFQPGNTCGKGDGSGGGSTSSGVGGSSKSGVVRDNAFDGWRKRDEKELSGIRERIAATQEIATQLMDDSKAKLDKLHRDKARNSDERDGLKEKAREAQRKLEQAAMEHSDSELKARLEKMDPIRRELFLTENKQSDPRVEAVRQERLNARALVQASAAKVLELSKKIDQEEAFSASIAKDSRVEAWREVEKYSAQTATDVLAKDGDAYSKELFDKVRNRFSGEMQSLPISGKASPEDMKRFDEGPKKEAAEFLSMVVNPATMSADRMKAANVNVDNIGRAYASGDTIHVGPYSSASTVVHELGHIYESGDPSIRDAAVAFHRHRCDESQNVKMSEVVKDAGYKDSEVGNTDDFRKAVEAVYKSGEYDDPNIAESRVKSTSAYLGKTYKDASGETKATELISIGLELMHHNPSAFAKADPEYFDFMVGVVSGKIRRARKRKA